MKFKKDIKKFCEIEHTADLGLEIWGKTLPLFFANAAFGFYHLLYETSKIQDIHSKRIVLLETSLGDLLITWLSELNYLFQVEQFVMNSIRFLSIEETPKSFELSAELAGDVNLSYVTQARFEIKAVTYHQLKVEHTKSGYHTRIFFDI